MKDYLLNIWSSGNFEKLSESEMKDFFGDFGNWVQNLEDKNQLVTRHRIAGDFKSIINKDNDLEVSNSPSFGGKNNLSGTFIIRAESDEEATTIAKTCPPAKHLKDIIEIVEIAR